MIQEITMYTVLCDACGKDSNEGSDYACYDSKENAEDIAKDDNSWHIENDKHYCPDCFHFDDDDNLIIKPNFKP